MTSIAAQIPEPVLEQARALAEREGIPLEKIISLAVTQQFAPVEAGARTSASDPGLCLSAARS